MTVCQISSLASLILNLFSCFQESDEPPRSLFKSFLEGVAQTLPENIAPQKTIRVLSWTQKSTNYSWFDTENLQSMEKCHEGGYLDPRVTCEFFTEKDRLKEADALLFRGRKIPSEPLPPRIPSQKWIFHEIEPPHKTWLFVNLTHYNGMFNLTSTYSWDSDIPAWSRRTCVRDDHRFKAVEKVNYAAKKRKDVPVAWFVSRCFTQSKREDYVEKLQKHIKVDIYGKCGPKKCGTNVMASWQKDQCERNLLHANNSYKFYLAFENSLCEDYVTEKLWKTLSLDVIVVVMGGVDYNRIMPKDSFIDVRDYPSPKGLAKYLNFLDKNDEAYNQLLRRKISLRCYNQLPLVPLHCAICKKLHDTWRQKSIVHALDVFWSNRRCIWPEHYLQTKRIDDFGFELEKVNASPEDVSKTK